MVSPIRKDKFFIGYSTVNKSIPETRLYDIELVKRDILNHFMTKKGERVMNPNFGSIIWDLLFEPYIDSNRSAIVDDVKNIIGQEPRVELVDLSVTDGDYSITVEVLLNFKPYNLTESLYATFIKNNLPTNNQFIGDT